MTGPEATIERDPLQALQDYSLQLAGRLDLAANTLREGLPLISDTAAVNERLGEVGRPDLAITELAPQMSIDHPYEVAKLGNSFTPKFVMGSGVRETGELDYNDEPVREPIPITAEQLLDHRSTPTAKSYEQAVALRESGEYPALNSTTSNSHANEAAFLRLLNLFPKFTVAMVVNMSSPEHRSAPNRFEPELFVAYQLMSRLVDAADLYVRREENGRVYVDDWFLCR